LCGRFNLFTSIEMIMDDLNVERVLFTPPPRYNIAPTQMVAAVMTDEVNILDGMRWGYVPSWSKEFGPGLINARAESVFEKPSFSRRVMKGRCTIPADGFFEWEKAGGGKVPYYFRRADRRPMYFAGLWDTWGDIRTCTILTMDSEPPVSRVHDRMPVILEPKVAMEYLGTDNGREEIEGIFRSKGPELSFHRVGQEVNSANTEGEALIRPFRDWF